MFQYFDCEFSLEHVATTADTAIATWRERFLFGDGTVFHTHEATTIRVDLKTCLAVTWDQIMDPHNEKALWAHFDKMVAAGTKFVRPGSSAKELSGSERVPC